MAHKKESFFWTSYSDLMTSLFFVMLVLFILVIVLLHKRMEATEAQLQEIKKVEESTKDLNKDYFEYRPEYKNTSSIFRFVIPQENQTLIQSYHMIKTGNLTN